MAFSLSASSAVSLRPSSRGTALVHAAPVARTGRTAVRATADDEPLKGEGGIAPGAFQWPPKAITESGEPLPEDDPTKPEGKEDKPRSESNYRPKDSPFDKKGGPGESERTGTQQGGGGEGSAA